MLRLGLLRPAPQGLIRVSVPMPQCQWQPAKEKATRALGPTVSQQQQQRSGSGSGSIEGSKLDRKDRRGARRAKLKPVPAMIDDVGLWRALPTNQSSSNKQPTTSNGCFCFPSCSLAGRLLEAAAAAVAKEARLNSEIQFDWLDAARTTEAPTTTTSRPTRKWMTVGNVIEASVRPLVSLSLSLLVGSHRAWARNIIASIMSSCAIIIIIIVGVVSGGSSISTRRKKSRSTRIESGHDDDAHQ